MRKIVSLHSAPEMHWVGDGFPVRSLISQERVGDAVSPFLLLDHAGPWKFEPSQRQRGVGDHPHRGFETVTIVYSGEVAHRDSTGAGGVIGPGDVQWMTAASGIVHQEFHSPGYAAKGGDFEMVQLWVNLPAKDKMSKPHYQTILDADIPSVALTDDAGIVRVVAGDFEGREGPAQSFTPIDIWDVRLNAGKRATLSLPEGHTLAIAVLGGEASIDETKLQASQLAVFDLEGGAVEVAATSDAKLLVLSGEPIDEPVVAYGPFVMNTPAEIRAAITDYQSGKFGVVGR
jgi:redox-sensitive bicupin YhaK (pirin superfamily)